MVEKIKHGDPVKGSEEGIESATIELLSRIISEAKSLSPVDTGQLRGSLMWKTSKMSGGFEKGEKLKEEVKEFQGIAGTAALHAMYQEFGTRKMKPQPFLRPAIAIWAKGQNAQAVLKKVQIEKMKGALKGGVKRVRF